MVDAPLNENTKLLLAEPKVSRSQARIDLFMRDLYYGIHAWRLWITLGWNDIALRYRRSVLGPLWMTLSMGILVISLGFIYSQIFHARDLVLR